MFFAYMWHIEFRLYTAHHISFPRNQFSVKYRFPFQILRFFFKLFFCRKITSVTQRLVSQENAFQKSKYLLLFSMWAMGLRVRAFFHKTVRVCHVYCNFKIGCTCRITVIFGTLKDGSLLINTLVSNICFSYRNMFQNGVDAFSKIVDAFLSKSSTFYLVRIIR